MGMAASQARLLTLQARQSDLEYQGQQINQERSVLSQQVTNLYNSLLEMNVPTPPSTSDYTTVQYSGTVGATAYSFDASSVKPCSKNGDSQTYYVTVKQSAYGDSLDRNPNIAVVDNASQGKITCLQVNDYVYTQVTDTTIKYTKEQAKALYFDKKNATTGITTKEQVTDADLATLFDLEDGKYTLKTDLSTAVYSRGDKTTFTQTDISSLYIKTSTGVSKANIDTHFDTTDNVNYTIKDAYAGKLFKQTNGVGTQFLVDGAVSSVTVDGHPVYTPEQAKTQYGLTSEQYSAYSAAVQNSGLTKPNGDPYDLSEFYMYFNDDSEACFVLQTDVKDGNDNAITYKYIANGDYEKNTTYPDCKLTFDPTSGRITSISMPADYTTGEDGKTKVKTYTTMEVAATTISDDMAYEDAYNQYEYAKFQYDQKQQEINAQTEVIQQMDRNLELKLQRLDNEREQITNEVEALDKVISENIQNSYKTFSG